MFSESEMPTPMNSLFILNVYLNFLESFYFPNIAEYSVALDLIQLFSKEKLSA